MLDVLPETAPPSEPCLNVVSSFWAGRSKKVWAIRVVTIIYFCFLLFMLLHPDPWAFLGLKSLGSSVGGFSVLHLLIFAVLAFGTELGRTRFPLIFWIATLLLLGPATELLQICTGRGFEWIDILEDTAGVTLGVILGNGFRRLPAMRRIVPPLAKDGINGQKGE